MIESYLFGDDGQTPNNPLLPFVFMHGVAVGQVMDPADWFERQFSMHGWGACWRWGVYRYHHFHSTNHEVLGVSRGSATLQLGGERGGVFEVRVGDVIVIPAGVGHKCMEASDDFEVVGAYPRGEEPDLIRSGEGDLDAARLRISHVPLPEQDPVHGLGGPLFDYW
jgi:uncharacterized protein YjlB